MINKKKIIEEAERSLKDNNKVKIKILIKDFLNRKSIKKDYIFWPNALIVYGLILCKKKTSIYLVNRQIELFRRNKYKITNFDDALMIYLLIKHRTLLDVKDIDIIKERMFLEIKKYKNKIIPYRETDPNDIFIDLLGMVTPFLCIYSNNNQTDIIDWSVSQFDFFIKYGIDQETGLPFHSYDLQSKDKNGIVGWSRSLGWILFGLSECIDCLYEKQDSRYSKLLNYYNMIFERTIEYIREDGGYSWQIITKDGHLDTSGTAMILLSLLTLKTRNLIDDKYDKYIHKMMNCLKNNEVNGKIINCSAECRGLGLYPQIYGSYPWSVGPTLASLMKYSKLFSDRSKG